METLILNRRQSQFIQFQDPSDNGNTCQDSLNENTHSIYLKNSDVTSDSLRSSSSQESIEEIEDSIMNWFGMKGIANGNPEDIIEKARENERKLKRMDFTLKCLNNNKHSSLFERRKNSSSN